MSNEVEDMNKRTKYDEEVGGESKKIRGKVVLMKKKLLNLDIENVVAWARDLVDEKFGGNEVSLQLISAVSCDTAKGLRGKVGKSAKLKDWSKITSPTANDSEFSVTFDWDEGIGVPGAFIIRNTHHTELYLKTLTLEDVPGHGRIHFVCNSWVYPVDKYKRDRVFFTNQTYLPSETPEALRPYREEELLNLRGDGTGKLEEWDRVYDYAVYNDLGDPDKGSEYVRPILGGSTKYPYPRRGRTGRPKAKEDPEYESRLPLLKSLYIYVPRDERFSHIKMSDVVIYGLKSIVQFLLPEIKAPFDKTPNEFDQIEDILKLYEGGIKLPDCHLIDSIRKEIPFETLKELLRPDGDRPFKFPVPQVIKEDKSAWRTDDEFAREMLAGLNPVVICRLQEFPPKSNLDPKVYGKQDSSMTEEHIKDSLDGLTIQKAIKNNKMFILDYHDTLMPYLTRINNMTSTKTYATRTVLFLKNDGTLKPLAIELSLPHPEGDEFGAISRVCTPAEHGVEGTIWQLAKAYVAVNDSGFHQLICHWLHTHAAIEPFIIATNRQLSVLHPINKLLHPHFRDTMTINALARQTLINGGGLLEKTLFPGKFCMEISSVLYKDWVFPEQALPADLIKRGMAVEDSNSPHGVRLLVEDYPYAVDGLEVWSAIKSWVQDYCNFYYESNEMVQKDTELQSWWKELREKGHGDKKDEPWWPNMKTREDLINTCTIIIWVASALHAAVNFGQYPYGGYPPNRPAMSRRFIPEPGTPDYDELDSAPTKAFLKTITGQLLSVLGISLIEILSKHSSDEVFLGQRDTLEWTTDTEPLKAFENFGKRLKEIEEKIIKMNKDDKWKNRTGPANMPYTLLIPASEVGLTGKGIPNSVSI
ncbi:probable linoleate 9S-lipoxygenase 5 [Cornus florida]|uniref:probable linoleate 9S-lipoxygenase 5 n=1 Tax=Cornus florida TaxID=4283 RepID=UPI002898DD7F|nr:probable linoleate 9S-lipoxygenase 5 [Cornus florida]